MIPLSSTHEHRPPPDCIALPVREVLTGSRRLDGEVYLSPGFLIRRQIQASELHVSLLGDLAAVWQPPRLKGIRVGREHGEPYLAATQVFDIWPTPRKWLAPKLTPHLADRYVEPGWILVTCSGSVGNPIISYSAQAGCVISHDLLRVQPQDSGMRGYVYAFLRTRFGSGMMQATQYGNIIKHLEPEHLAALPIPIVEDLVEATDGDVTDIFDARDRAYRMNMEARKLLSDALGKPEESDLDVGFARSASSLRRGGRRLEAYYHNPTVAALSELFASSALDVQRMGTIADAFVPSRFKRIYGESGVPYLDSEPLFKINPGISKRLTPATRIEVKDYQVEPGWVLMACSGQIYGLNGSAILANRWHAGKVITQHVMRIVPDRDKVHPGYLETVLSHPSIGQPLVTALAHGTSVPEIAPEDLLNLEVPRLAQDIEGEISKLAEEASRLRMEADNKENGAVARLEEALEAELEKSKAQPVRLARPAGHGHAAPHGRGHR